MSGVSNVIYVSENVKQPKQKRSRPAKSPSKASTARKAPPSGQRSRSRSVSSSVESDVEEAESIAQNDTTGDPGAMEQLDYDLMEEESVHFGDSESEEEKEGGDRESDKQEATPARAPKAKMKKSRKPAGPPSMESFINQTAFDVYFSYASSKLRTSNNVLSSLIEPLTHEEVHRLGRDMETRSGQDPAIQRLCKAHESYFPNYWFELHNGFNLLFHGYGSKRSILTDFGRNYCAKNGHVITINGNNKRATLKAILTALEQIPKFANAPLHGPGWESQLWRIYDFFRDERHAKLYLLIHNIESPSLRDRKISELLSTLALHPRVHLIASADHINTSFLWSAAEVSARKHPPSPNGAEIPSQKGYSWLFHELTTFRPYVSEMKMRDISTLPGQNLGSTVTVAGQALTEPAMSHILASVTEKAKKLFKLLATRQMGAVDDAMTGVSGLEKYGMQYDLLFNEARKEFLATSDVALRALLGEFMDHGMILSGGQPEVLWIPAGKEAIKRVLEIMETSS